MTEGPLTMQCHLLKPKDFPFAVYDAQAFARLETEIFESDAMYAGNDTHYLGVGVSALNIVQATQLVTDTPKFNSILDFGAGAGRVARWFRAAFPEADLTVADLRSKDLEFCAAKFGADVWTTTTDVGRLEAPGLYDLIWVGSVITHLPAMHTTILLAKFLEWLTPNGIAIASFHGREGHRRLISGSYIDASCRAGIVRGYDDDGYGYADYPNQSGYGISICSVEWVTQTLASMRNVRIALISERAWDNHHDVVAFNRVQGRSS